jgi:hypothetical protein
VVTGRGRPKRAPEPETTSETEQPSTVERAYALARAGCSDAEIVATLADETGMDHADLAPLLSDEAMAAQLEAKRIAGRGALRAYAFTLAQTAKPTAATIQLAMWLSRQMLGYSPKGVGEDIESAMGELDGMTREEVKVHLRKVADEL